MTTPELRAAAAAELLKRRTARNNLTDFATYTNAAYQAEPVHELIAGRLDAVQRGELKRLIVIMPELHGKSELAAIRFPAYVIGTTPGTSIVLSGHTPMQMEHKGAQIAATVNSEPFQFLYGAGEMTEDERLPLTWNYTGNHHGILHVLPVGEETIFRGARLGIIDDYHRHEKDKTDAWRWYNESFLPTLAGNASIVIIATQKQSGDLIDRIAEREGDEWEIIRFAEECESAKDRQRHNKRLGLPLRTPDPLGRRKGQKILSEPYSRTGDGSVERWFRESAREKQKPPEGDWTKWLILAGRGFGKSVTIVHWSALQAKLYPGSRGHIVAATAADARDVLVNGPSGFLSVLEGDDKPEYFPSKRLLVWPNGSQALLFSAQEPERLRGPQCHWAICDELAAWKYPEAWDQLMFGLRLGEDPRVAIATTPKPTKLVKELLDDDSCHITRGSTYENKGNLADAFFKQIIKKYEGTRLGRQELNAEVLEDVEGALWTISMIEELRVKEAPEDLLRVVVGVDPKISVTANSETGIVVGGKTYIHEEDVDHFYILGDYSIDGTPKEWAQRAIHAYYKHDADAIVVEVNQGGDMVKQIIHEIDSEVHVIEVRATRGKYTRAEPIAAKYEQGRVFHVGDYPKLESQMTEWVPGEASPDRLDALVWAVTELSGEDGGLFLW